MVIGLTFQNETEYKRAFLHEYMSERKLVRCEMNTKEKGGPPI